MKEGMTVCMMMVEDESLKGKLPWSYTDLSNCQELFSLRIFPSGVWECGRHPVGFLQSEKTAVYKNMSLIEMSASILRSQYVIRRALKTSPGTFVPIEIKLSRRNLLGTCKPHGQTYERGRKRISIMGQRETHCFTLTFGG